MRQQVKYFSADGHWLVACIAFDPREFGVGLARTFGEVYAVHFFNGHIHGGVAIRKAVAPQFHADRGTHDGFFALEPAAIGRVVQGTVSYKFAGCGGA